MQCVLIHARGSGHAPPDVQTLSYTGWLLSIAMKTPLTLAHQSVLSFPTFCHYGDADREGAWLHANRQCRAFTFLICEIHNDAVYGNNNGFKSELNVQNASVDF